MQNNYYNKARIIINNLEARKLPSFGTEVTLPDSWNYILCKECSLLLSICQENQLEISNRKITVIKNILEDKVTREVQETYSKIFCKRCQSFIGISLDTDKFVFFTKRIRTNANFCVSIGLFGLKLDKLIEIEKVLIADAKYGGLCQVKTFKQTKEGLSTFKRIPRDHFSLDVVFIVHKIEGRVFLLGKNGFFNKFLEEMQTHHNIYFILIFKSKDIAQQAIDDLIEKGDQANLKVFRDQNKIISLQEDQTEENILHMILDNVIPYPESKHDIPEKLQSLVDLIVENKSDLTKIDFDKTNFKFKCFML